MSDFHTHVHTVFKSDLLRVMDYRCAGHGDAQEEIPQGYEIVLPRAGAYQRRDAYGTFLADPNQVLFYNKGEPYDISHPIQGGDVSTVFMFASSLLIEMMRRYDPNIEDDACEIFPRSHITLAARLQILQYRFLLANQNSADLLEMEEEVIVSTGEIIHALYQERRARQKRSANTVRAHAEQTHAVKIFLNVHFQSPLQLKQISSAVHLSPYHLCRVFKQNTGMTLHQYVKRLRLFNAAEQMLENPGARLDLLALDYGFSNHGNFSTAFRQTFGINPSELRSAHLRQISSQMSKILKA